MSDAGLPSSNDRLDRLEQEVAWLRRFVRKPFRFADEDPEIALIQARKAVEAIGLEVFKREVSPNVRGHVPLDRLLQKLAAKGAIPPFVELPLRTIQAFGNFGEHHRDEHVPLSREYVEPCLSSLSTVTSWYVRTYSGLDSIAHWRSAPPPPRSIPARPVSTTPPQPESYGELTQAEPDSEEEPTTASDVRTTLVMEATAAVRTDDLLGAVQALALVEETGGLAESEAWMHQSVLERLSQEVNPTPLHPCSFRDRHADVLIAGLPVWQAAAERSFAQYVLGVVHDDGTGVTQSDTKAVSWYRKAGEQGNSDAEIALARLSR